MKTAKSVLTAVMLSSVALASVSTVTVLATTDAAYAKSDKANGGNKGGKSADAKGKGKGKDNERSKSQSSSKGGKGKENGKGKSSSVRGGVAAFEGFLDRVTGKDKKKVKTVRAAKVERKAVSASAPVQTAAAPARPAKGSGLHPSELGKMNGALNANVNALVAHLKNGNTNGPIGGMAALAAAGYAAEGQADIVALEGKYASLDEALIANGYVDADGNPDLAAYQADIAGIEGQGEIAEIEDAIDAADADGLDAALIDGGFVDADGNADLSAYEAFRDGVPGADPIETVDSLVAELDGETRPDEDDLARAEELLAAQSDAESNMLAIWNKNPDSDPDVVTEAEQDLLDVLYNRIEADGDTLRSAIETYAPPPEPSAGDESECDLDGEACLPEDGEITLLTE